MLFTTTIAITAILRLVSVQALELPKVNSIPGFESSDVANLNREMTKLDERLTKFEREAKPTEAVAARQEKRGFRESLRRFATQQFSQKLDLSKFRATAESFGAAVKILNSSDPNRRLQGVMTLMSSIADIIPGPIGAIFGTMFSLASAMYRANTPGLLQKFNELVLTHIQDRHYKDMKRMFSEKDTRLDLLRIDLDECQRKMDEEVRKCVESRATQADRESLDQLCYEQQVRSDKNIRMWTSHLKETKDTVDYIVTELAGIRQVISDETRKITSLKHLSQVYHVFLMYAELRVRNLEMLRDLSQAHYLYVQEGHNYALTRYNYDVKESEKWEQGMVKTGSPTAAAFALYLIYKDRTNPALRSVVSKLSRPMEELKQRGSFTMKSNVNKNFFLVATGSDWLRYKADCFDEKSGRNITWINGHMGAGGTCSGTNTHTNYDVMQLQWTEPQDSTKGVHVLVPAQKGEDARYISINGKGWLLGERWMKRDEASSFAMFPVYLRGRESVDGWLIAPLRDGTAPVDYFTLWETFTRRFTGFIGLWKQNFDDFPNIGNYFFTIEPVT